MGGTGRRGGKWWLAALATALIAPAGPSQAVDRLVSSTSQFAAALAAAEPGDFISLAPGIYDGGHYRAGLTEVTIRSEQPKTPAILRGGSNGIQLSDATNVTLEDLIFEQQTGNGLNIDDGGSFDTPSAGITLQRITVRDMNATGNNDGIKLSGVTGFLVDRVVVENWGDGGSAIDPVGCHNGVIQNSIFRHDTGGSSGVRPKGGSKNLRILANRFEMPGGFGRAIQAGGSTGSQFFRFIDGDSGYEADSITAAGNLIVDAHAALSYVNIDGGDFHHNWLQNPRNWAVRILNENPGTEIVDTQNGRFADNVIEYDGTAWSRAVNVGGETMPETFTFARNQWLNTAGETSVDLPVSESDGQYGNIDVLRQGDAVRWDFGWGHWVVYPAESGSTETLATEAFHNLLLATPDADATFDPSADDPLAGSWTFAPSPGPNVTIATQQNYVLILPTASAVIPSLPGDYDRSGTVDQQDFQLWKRQRGVPGPALSDGNGDGQVDQADYTIWRDNLGASNVAPGRTTLVVPEPACGELLLMIAGVLGRLSTALP